MAPRTVAAFFAKADRLSIELGKRVMSPAEVEAYLRDFEAIVAPNTRTRQASARLDHKSKDGVDVKLRVLGTDVVSLFHEQTTRCRIDDDVSAVSTSATPIAMVPQTADSATLAVQFGFDLLADSTWKLKISLVKRLDNPLEFTTRLGDAKRALVDVGLEEMSSDAFDYVQTEIVHVGDEPVAYADAEKIISLVNADAVGEKAYQEAIFGLARDIFRTADMAARFRRESGFKRLCPSTVELNRPIYFKQVRPHIDDYFITDKMDGTRAMLVIDELFKRTGRTRRYLGANIYAVSDRLYEISTFMNVRTRSAEIQHTVLDTEMMPDGSFHCFDVIALQSRRICGLPFFKRLEQFPAAQLLMEKHGLGSTKEFIRLTKDGFAQQIREFYTRERDYEIDGVVLTPMGSFYKEARQLQKSRFQRIFNTEYSNTISFKWKPIDRLTIDFYLMAHGDGYVLCSGVDRRTFELLRMSFFDGYVAPKSPRAFQYFPIQFDPTDGSFDYHWKPSKKDQAVIGDLASLDGMVGEFQLADADKVLAAPRLLRVRLDRIPDIARGEYYGNALRYSELIWHSIRYPLKMEDLGATQSEAYFAAEDEAGWYKASRGFNSFAKTQLLETYLPPGKNATIMDVAAGKGQDLARVVELGYGTVVALDRDVDALSEMLERKYNLRVRSKTAQADVHIHQMDLENSAEHNVKELKMAKASADSIMINFALHYICHAAFPDKPEPLTEFAKLCAHYAKPKGRVMITAFNGEDVMHKLGQTEEWRVMESDRVKYSIRRAFSSPELAELGQAIDVLLPFSAGNYYREYLVNYQYVQRVFEQQGFTLVKSDSFASLMHRFKAENPGAFKALTPGDKEYVALYGYLIFERK